MYSSVRNTVLSLSAQISRRAVRWIPPFVGDRIADVLHFSLRKSTALTRRVHVASDSSRGRRRFLYLGPVRGEACPCSFLPTVVSSLTPHCKAVARGMTSHILDKSGAEERRCLLLRGNINPPITYCSFSCDYNKLWTTRI